MKIISLAILGLYLIYPQINLNHNISHIYHYNFYSEIDFDSVAPLEATIQDLQPTDTLYIYINSPGGIVDAGNELIDVIHSSKGHTIAVTEYFIASMAIDVSISCNELIVGIQGQEPIAIIHAAFIDLNGHHVHVFPGLGSTHRLQIKRYSPFLTKEELHKVFDNWEDLILPMHSFVDRVNASSHVQTQIITI